MTNCRPQCRLSDQKTLFLQCLLYRTEGFGTTCRYLVLFSTLILSVVVHQSAYAADAKPPNIVLIIADDLGYAELGCYGQEKIKTPHIDKMATEGMRFTQFYAGNAVCAPSRCCLMTGKHPGHAHVRTNHRNVEQQHLQDKYGWEYLGQAPIPAEEITIAELLKQKGYATGAMGKWGLGHFGTTGDPNKQGFDLFFGYNCQAHAHSFYPGHLWRNNQKIKLKNDPPIPGHASLPKDADPSDPASYDTYNGSDYTADHVIDVAEEFLRKNAKQPFFLYFPSTIPHLALHIPDEELKPYLDQNWEETPFTGGRGYTPHQTPKAAYAAMISRLDKDVGRLMSLLKELEMDENTLVLFSSDNGTTHLRKEVDYEFFNSVGPLRGLKGSLYEGGIRVPMVARWPGKIKPGTVTGHKAAFWDFLPTITDAAGIKAPADVDGISFLPTLLGKPNQKEHEYLYWEFPSYGGQQAIIKGDWKAIRQKMMVKANEDPLKIELYNLKEDIGETNDVAAKHPEIVKELDQLMKQAHTPSEMFRIPALDGPAPLKKKPDAK